MNARHVHRAETTRLPYGSVRTALTLPSPEGATFEHDLHGFCWCQPLVEEVPPEGRLFIHRDSVDTPHIRVAR